MKKYFFSIALILSTFCCGCTAHAKEPQERQIENDKRYFILEKAKENIFDNLSLLAAMRKEFGEAAMLEWAMPLADKIPTQPVAVIRLMAITEYPVEKMCPRLYIEDMASFGEMVRWMEQAAAALEAFRMTDAREEGIRAACLKEIRKALADKEKWRFPK